MSLLIALLPDDGSSRQKFALNNRHRIRHVISNVTNGRSIVTFASYFFFTMITKIKVFCNSLCRCRRRGLASQCQSSHLSARVSLIGHSFPPSYCLSCWLKIYFVLFPWSDWCWEKPSPCIDKRDPVMPFLSFASIIPKGISSRELGFLNPSSSLTAPLWRFGPCSS